MKEGGKVKAWKNQQQDQFAETIPFSDTIFFQLFRHLDKKMGKGNCKHNFELTTAFLKTKKIKFEDHRNFFIENGGGCDCEVLMNVQEPFVLLKQKNTRRKPNPKTLTREKLNSLN